MTNPLGLYIHIPFCNKKCTYCDFYSVFPIGNIKGDYFSALLKEIKKWGGKAKNRPIDTIYIGGGTPSVLGEDIITLLNSVRENFNVLKNAEITAEANPEDVSFLDFAKKAGVTRLSVGAQSFNDDTLKILGRRHTALDTVNFFNAARDIGFNNISLDLMLGLPQNDFKADLKKITELNPEHISAYMLKREKNTAFYKFNTLLPGDEESANEYLFASRFLKQKGYTHYEISNFAKSGCQSRHNLKYWECKEYIGIGPAAHSFFEGNRFYYKRDIKSFINNPETVFDDIGGSGEEKMMLSLRLKKGIDLSEYYEEIPKTLKQTVKKLKAAGLIGGNFPKICLTDKGMLLSNSIIAELIL